MKSALVGLVCLIVGAGATLGYDYFLGWGKQLAQALYQLDLAKADLAKAAADNKQARSETDAMTAQIQQLNATKDDLKKQVDDLKNQVQGQNPAPAANSPVSMFSPTNMAAIVKAQTEQKHKERLQMLISRLHLTPEQIAEVEAAMDAEDKRTEALTSKMFAGGKMDPQAVKDAMAQSGNVKSVDQTLQEIMTPDQKTAYAQMQTDQKNSSAEMMASMQMNQMSTQLQLTEAQKTQVETALYQTQLDTQDPNWIKNNVGEMAKNPLAILDAQAKAKEDALSKILTPDQLATYHQQAQAQLDMQRTMMQKFMPSAGVTVTPAATPAPAPAPAPASP